MICYQKNQSQKVITENLVMKLVSVRCPVRVGNLSIVRWSGTEIVVLWCQIRWWKKIAKCRSSVIAEFVEQPVVRILHQYVEGRGRSGWEQTWNWVTGSPGQWVIWVIFSVWVTGSPGHHYDPVCDPVFFILKHRFVVQSVVGRHNNSHKTVQTADCRRVELEARCKT